MASEPHPSKEQQATSQPSTTEEDQLPAYDATTGTLDFRLGGINTQTQVGNDGRVNIHINETDSALANQLEQISLLQNADPSSPSTPASPPPYASSSTGPSVAPPITTSTTASSAIGKHAPPPPLNIVIHVVGSRGDVQPFVALGRVLSIKYHHRIRLATHKVFKTFVEENGLEFFDIGGDPAELMAFMVKNPGLIPGMDSVRKGEIGRRQKGIGEIVRGCWRSCADVREVDGDEHEGHHGDEHEDGHEEGEREHTSGRRVKGERKKPFIANAIIANPPSFAHIHCAEKLGIPLHLMFTMPWSPTSSFPHPIANIKSSNANGSMTNEMTYTIVELMTWQGLGDTINTFRKEVLGLTELSPQAATTMLHRLKVPYTYCWSPALIPKPKDWGPHITISGFYFLSLATNFTPDPSLATFLSSGPPPVYIGFGSIVVDDPNAMTSLIFSAIKRTGQRALVSKGWGGFGGNELEIPENIYMLGNVPHDYLFQHVSAVVHHGGAGTTAAGIALGRPTVVVPFFGDQPFWGAMVERAGAGPKPIPNKELTDENLAAAILEALKPETLERARELGEKIREEKGCEVGAESFHKQMNMQRIRCMLVPNKVAVWRVKTKDPDKEDIRLSAFAAAVLGDEGLLDLNTLRLYRPYEYPVEESRIVSNLSGANPVLGTFGSFASAVVSYPVHRAKAWGGIVTEPYKGAKSGGWKGFGKGLGKGIGHAIFPKRGFITMGGKSYGVRPLFGALKRKYGGDPTAAFILAGRFVEGVEEAKAVGEEERKEVVRAWMGLGPPELKRVKTGASTSGESLMGLSSSSTISERSK